MSSELLSARSPHKSLTSVWQRGIDQWQLLFRVGLRPGSPAAVAFAVLCVGAATAVRVGIEVLSPDSAVFACYCAATLVAALVGGVAAGGLAAVVGGITAYALFLPPDWTSEPFLVAQVFSLVLYAASSSVIIWAAERHRALVADLRREKATRQLLNRELLHRIKNMVASVQAVVSQSLSDHPELCGKINGRLAALGATNDLLAKTEWQSASLREILAAELSPYGIGRFHLHGEDVNCPSGLAVMLALVLHELAINAVKYGALSRPNGWVEVVWASAGDRLELQWIEFGGPATAPPQKAGFGTKLLRSGVRQFDGTVDITFDPKGLRCRLSVALNA
jgi:two-component sensor histidine kinase